MRSSSGSFLRLVESSQGFEPRAAISQTVERPPGKKVDYRGFESHLAQLFYPSKKLDSC
jgi:hypothetical protein